jgi:hypothetical protein
VQDNGQAFCEVPEVPIRSKDGQVTSDGDGTNQEVGIRALNTLGSTQVEKLRGVYKIFAQQGNIRECVEVGFETRELRTIPHTGENFLPNRPDDFGNMGHDKTPQLLRLRMEMTVCASQRQ